MNVLVAYASKYGSTREIAERIAERLQLQGLQAEARSVQDLDDLVDYDAFVVGGAVFAGHWMPEATEFVRRNRALLAHGPVWLFSSGPIGATAKKYDTPAEPKEIAELRRALGPWGHRVFFGAWDPSKLDRGRLGFAERMIAKVLPRGDFRDWEAIQAWATSIARALPGSADGGALRRTTRDHGLT
jgi:menaquinone-dependent protoporphyrinogen oxidase